MDDRIKRIYAGWRNQTVTHFDTTAGPEKSKICSLWRTLRWHLFRKHAATQWHSKIISKFEVFFCRIKITKGDTMNTLNRARKNFLAWEKQQCSVLKYKNRPRKVIAKINDTFPRYFKQIMMTIFTKINTKILCFLCLCESETLSPVDKRDQDSWG